MSTDNERANRLKQNASDIADSTDITIVSEMPFLTSAIDYSTMDSSFTVCPLLAHDIHAGGSLMTPNTHGGGVAEDSIFQVNHARIVEPNGSLSSSDRYQWRSRIENAREGSSRTF